MEDTIKIAKHEKIVIKAVKDERAAILALIKDALAIAREYENKDVKKELTLNLKDLVANIKERANG